MNLADAFPPLGLRVEAGPLVLRPITDEVLVMHEGRVAGELARDRLTEEAVMHLATGGGAA